MSRDQELLSRITVNPGQCVGKPCIRGQRLRVQDVLEMMAGGMSEAQLLTDYPYLVADDIRACLIYAARRVSHPEVAA